MMKRRMAGVNSDPRTAVSVGRARERCHSIARPPGPDSGWPRSFAVGMPQVSTTPCGGDETQIGAEPLKTTTPFVTARLSIHVAQGPPQQRSPPPQRVSGH